jgi:predicted dehydrogenase
VIQINCIGLGHWGPNLVRRLTSSQRARIGTVCDLDVKRLELVQRNIAGQFSTSTDSLATATDPNCQAVVISTPCNTHYELTKAALTSGKHVLVEKPLAETVSQSAELTMLARKHGVILCVGHVFLFNQGIRYVKQLLDKNELGQVRYVFSERTNLGPFRHDVNALWDLGAHDISIFNYWFGSNPSDVTAFGMSYLNPELEDVVVANLTYPNQIMACVYASWLNPQKVREITVVGTRKSVVWNDMDLDAPVRIFDKSVHVENSTGYSDSFATFRMQVRTGDVVIPVIPGGAPLDAECNHFLDCVEGKAQPINDGEGGLQVVRALTAASESMKSQSLLKQVGAPAPALRRVA